MNDIDVLIANLVNASRAAGFARGRRLADDDENRAEDVALDALRKALRPEDGGITQALVQMARENAIKDCRAACLAVGTGAAEAAKAKDATDYIAGYQDAAVDCDEALRELLPQVEKP